MEIFEFCEGSRVAKEVAPDETPAINMNGWDYTVRPTEPYRRTFVITLEGLHWYVSDGFLDLSQDTMHNAGLLLKFYRDHRLYRPFLLHHEYLGPIQCRFLQKVDIDKAVQNSRGLIDAFDVHMVHHNPGY